MCTQISLDRPVYDFPQAGMKGHMLKREFRNRERTWLALYFTDHK
jgi:hypothetical protein